MSRQLRNLRSRSRSIVRRACAAAFEPLEHRTMMSATPAGHTLGTAGDLGNLDLATTAVIDESIGGAGNTEDFYRFSLSTTRNVDVLMNNLTANADMQVLVDVVNPGVVDSGEVLVSSTSGGTSFDHVSPTMVPGNYFLRVFRNANSATNYRLNVNSLPGGSPDDNGGNSAFDPKALGTLDSTGLSALDFIGAGDGADVYRFELPRLSRVKLDIDGLSSNADLKLFTASGPNFNENSEVTISTSVNSGIQPDSIEQTLLHGTYFLRVFPREGSTYYRLAMRVTQEDAAGEDRNTARVLGTLSDRTFNERIGGVDTNDFYRFDLSALRNVAINVSGLSTADVDLQLINNNGTVIETASHQGSANERISRKLVPGTYYVRVLPKTGEGPYTINFHPTTVIDAALNTLLLAKPLGPIHHGDALTLADYVGPDDTMDAYAFTIPNGSTVSSTFSGSGSGVSTFFVQDRNTDGLIQSSEKISGIADLVPGAYYLCIQRNGTTGTLYNTTLRANEINDGAGNSRSNARNLGEITGTQTVSGYVGFDDTADYYKFNVDWGTNSGINIELSNLVGDADLTLYNDKGEVLETSKKGGTTTDKVSRYTPFGGTFYVKVQRYGSANTTYDLKFTR